MGGDQKCILREGKHTVDGRSLQKLTSTPSTAREKTSSVNARVLFVEQRAPVSGSRGGDGGGIVLRVWVCREQETLGILKRFFGTNTCGERIWHPSILAGRRNKIEVRSWSPGTRPQLSGFLFTEGRLSNAGMKDKTDRQE